YGGHAEWLQGWGGLGPIGAAPGFRSGAFPCLSEASGRDPGPDPGPGAGGRQAHELLVPGRPAVLEPIGDGFDEVVDDRVRRPLVQVGWHLSGPERSGRVDRPFPQLAGVVGELGLACGVTPEEMEPVRVLTGDSEQRAGADAPRPLRVPDHELLGEPV